MSASVGTWGGARSGSGRPRKQAETPSVETKTQTPAVPRYQGHSTAVQTLCREAAATLRGDLRPLALLIVQLDDLAEKCAALPDGPDGLPSDDCASALKQIAYEAHVLLSKRAEDTAFATTLSQHLNTLTPESYDRMERLHQAVVTKARVAKEAAEREERARQLREREAADRLATDKADADRLEALLARRAKGEI